jgi:hypothetical protein
MDLQFGTPKSLDEITLTDVQQHPIWLWVWEAGLEQQAEDETWQYPVTNTTDVTAGMIEPIISLRIKGTELIGSASYDPEAALEAIAVWQDGAWAMMRDSKLQANLSRRASTPLTSRLAEPQREARCVADIRVLRTTGV